MPPLGDHVDGFSGNIDRVPAEADARGRLECNARHDVLTGGDPAENPACVVRTEACGCHLVTMLGALLRHAGKAGADLHALGGVDAHERMGDIRIEAVEDGLSEPRGCSRCDHCNLGPDGVSLLAQVIHVLFEFRNLVGIGKEEGILFHLAPVVRVGADWPECRKVAVHLDPHAVFQILFCDGPCCNAHGGFPRRGTAAATVIPDTVFLKIGVIRMARTKTVSDIGIVLRTLVLVEDNQPDRRTGCLAFKNTGKDLHLVGFATLCRVTRLARTTALEILLDVGLAEFDTGRTAVDDAADRDTVAFTKRSDCEEFTDGVPGHSVSWLLQPLFHPAC